MIAFIMEITHRKEIEKNMLAWQKTTGKKTNDIRLMNTEMEGKVEEQTLILEEAL